MLVYAFAYAGVAAGTKPNAYLGYFSMNPIFCKDLCLVDEQNSVFCNLSFLFGKRLDQMSSLTTISLLTVVSLSLKLWRCFHNRVGRLARSHF